MWYPPGTHLEQVDMSLSLEVSGQVQHRAQEGQQGLTNCAQT